MPMEHFVPEGLQKEVKLNDDGVDKESVGQCGPRMVLDEGHQEPEPDEHHDIDVLIHGVVIGVLWGVGMNLRTDKNAIHDDDNDLNEKEESGENFSVSLVRIHFGGYKFY